MSSSNKQTTGTREMAKSPPIVERGEKLSRQTATFEPYYWEAYNEIVKPSRFDWYLVTRWLPDLGALGFSIVKALRMRCYHNPKTGITRNQLEIDMKELAASVGVSMATLYRELERNEPLQQFVQVQHQYVPTDSGKAPKRFKPEFTICMDDPIHSSDRQHYEQLRADKEAQRIAAEQGTLSPPSRFRVKAEPGREKRAVEPYSQNENKGVLPYSQNENYGGTNSHFENGRGGTNSQFEKPDSQIENDAPYISPIPFGDLFTKENSYTPLATPLSHKCDPPEGEESGPEGAEPSPESEDYDPLVVLWRVALSLLENRVSLPTLQAHLKTLRLGTVEAGEAIMIAPSAFTREWIDKRHRADIEQALSEAAGQPLTLRLQLASK